jgi:hypothetical protein
MGRGLRTVAIGVVALGALVAAGCTPRYTPPPTAGDNRYVALGDSYTAAPGVPPQTAVDIPLGCFQSARNYPHLIAPLLQLQFSDASCSGATTDDMTGEQNVTPGANAPQFDRLTPQTKVVTLGIGGNDIGFSEIAVQCTTLGLGDPNGDPCHDEYVVDGDDAVSDRIDELEPDLAAVLAEIGVRSPDAKVFVVGYPTILPETGDGCYPVVPIAAGDIAWVREKHLELNAAIESVAVANGAVYVDTYTPSIGHDACQPIGTKWVEPVVPTEPGFSIHPNLNGMRGMADAVIAAMRSDGVLPPLP